QDEPGGEDPTDPSRERGMGLCLFQRDELRYDAPVEADDVLKILTEFLWGFDKLRDDGPPKEILDIRDNSKDGEYWEAMAHVIPERTLKLWDALGAALLEYHKVLTRRAELLSEATVLQEQNS
ncbi:DRC1 protein, partial [Machaerirhynchus nigripectus]|nr:DRC1 protein [Machaerirhynchus nigripectus]